MMLFFLSLVRYFYSITVTGEQNSSNLYDKIFDGVGV